ncbi:outer membrane protein assembly factor BamC [Hahella sp. CR1]|uniref:outer membrane protein assembly factor BamC n=1 Tax=Hahella sp. CR1 TaxID=2992807 RepID=UPI002442AB52|nr:outer membrane protein assembly factor BamC [Hahella sp. CR1]MDG9668578.1 outer membrane protein assembly factor BamC [Hahella sp. CR1]
MTDRSNQYMQAERGDPLVVPEWYSTRRLQDRFPVPHAEKAFVASKDFVVPPPPAPGSDLLQEHFAIKKTADDIWLLASEPPGKVWPALKRYWESIGGSVAEVDTAEGRMQVSLPMNSLKASEFVSKMQLQPYVNNEQLQLQVRVQQGLKRLSSEVRVTVQGMPLMGPTPQQESLLTDMRQYMSDQGESLGSYSLVAQNIGGESRVSLVENADQPYLRVDLNYDRAWFALGQALNDSRIPVIDINRSEGVYFVRFVEKEHEKNTSWWSGWFGGKEEEKLSDRFNFRVLLSPADDGVHISSEPTSSDVGRQEQLILLNKILDNMS